MQQPNPGDPGTRPQRILIVDDDPSAIHRPAQDDDGAGDTQVSVLIVDDDADVRALCRRVLERAGYCVRLAVDGVDALASIQRDPPDVIVMDVAMPNMDGLECTRRLKADPVTREIPIIMASAASEEEEIVRGLEAGGDEYLPKPIKPKQFVLRVQSMARLYRSKADLLRSNAVRSEQARALCLLLDLSRSLNTAHDLDAILEQTVAATAELTLSRRISIMLPDVDGKYLNIAKAIGLPSGMAADVRVPLGAPTAGQVFLSGEAVVVNDPQEVRPSNQAYDSQFFVSAPLVSKPLNAAERAIGVLNITERQGRQPFEPRELEYIDMVCNLAASAIEETVTRRARDEARDSIVAALATLAECRDNATGRHLDRVTRFSVLLAEHLRNTEPFRTEIDEQFLHDLRRAVPLHDIGKVGVPDHILLKPGRLDDEEMAVIRRHSLIGAKAIRSVLTRTPGVSFLTMAEHIAYGHHEWFDGTGYPRQLIGREIPTVARITALADVYDALTTRRPYKEAVTHEEAVAIIRSESGTHFDPAVVEAFLARQQDFARLANELADDQPATALVAPPPAAQTIDVAATP